MSVKVPVNPRVRVARETTRRIDVPLELGIALLAAGLGLVDIACERFLAVLEVAYALDQRAPFHAGTDE